MEMLRLIDVDPKKRVVTPLPTIGRFAIGTLHDDAIPMKETTP